MPKFQPYAKRRSKRPPPPLLTEEERVQLRTLLDAVPSGDEESPELLVLMEYWSSLPYAVRSRYVAPCYRTRGGNWLNAGALGVCRVIERALEEVPEDAA